MRESVVVLLPDMRSEQVIQRCDLMPPGQLRRHLKPLGMLAEHGIHNTDKRFIAVENSMPSGEADTLPASPGTDAR